MLLVCMTSIPILGATWNAIYRNFSFVRHGASLVRQLCVTCASLVCHLCVTMCHFCVIRKNPDIRADRGSEHRVSIQIMLLVCMTSFPILGATWNTIYRKFSLMRHGASLEWRTSDTSPKKFLDFRIDPRNSLLYPSIITQPHMTLQFLLKPYLLLSVQDL